MTSDFLITFGQYCKNIIKFFFSMECWYFKGSLITDQLVIDLVLLGQFLGLASLATLISNYFLLWISIGRVQWILLENVTSAP